MKNLPVLIAAALLAACGQTGPLKLPEPKPAEGPAVTPAADGPQNPKPPQSDPRP